MYSQQFDYLYHDVSQAHITIKNLDSVKKTHLDLARGGEGRRVYPILPHTQSLTPTSPDQLVLPNDPDLAPDLLPLLDLEVLGDLDPMNLNIDNFLAQHLQELGADSQEVRSFTPSQGRLSGFMTPAGVNSSPGTIGRMSTPGFPGSGFGAPTSPVALDEDLRMDENPLFEFDENGMIREISPQLPVSPSAALGLRARRGREGGNLNSDDIEEQVRREHEAGQVDQQVNQGEELGGGYVPPTADHMNIDENAQPFADREELPDAPVQQEEEAEVAVPAARKPRAPKASHITIDDLTELNGRVLKEWDANYLENMDVAKQVLDDRRAKRDAKNTATILVLEYGIGGELVNPTLRAMFSGRALLDIFMGEDSDAKNKRKSPSHENGEIAEKEEEGRRVRLRTEDEGDMGRGFEPNMQDIDMEVGRDAPASIAEDDVQSLHSDMPWVPLSVDGIGSSSAPGSVADFSPLQARNIWGVSRMSAVGSVGSRLDVVEEVNENTMGVSREPSVDAFEFFGAGEWWRSSSWRHV